MNNRTQSRPTMETNRPSRFRQPNFLSTDRFLDVHPYLSSSDQPSSSSSPTEELNEYDIFFSGDFPDNFISVDDLLMVFPSSSPRNHKPFPHFKNFGIFVSISDPSRPHSHFYQKPSISMSASSSSSATSSFSLSSSRLIPSISKP
ncbi:hypothetical protein PTKIN_Ptkin11bG0062200 [Pterospermum kingtungense]